MRTPKLWQKLTAGFKKPFQKLFQKKEHTPKEDNKDFFRDSGESVYHQSIDARKLRKSRKRVENKSRAVNARKNKNWKK